MSLRQRILVLTVGACASVMVLFAIPVWFLLSHAAAQESRDQAVSVAHGLADYVSTGVSLGASTGTAPPQTLTAYIARLNARENRVQVAAVLPDGTRLGARLPAGAFADTDSDAGPAPGAGAAHPGGDADASAGLSAVSQPEIHDSNGGVVVSLRAATAAGPVTVLAYGSAAQARAQAVRWSLLLAAAALALLLLATGAVEAVTRRLIADLDRTSAAADRLAAGDLTARAPERQVAGEVGRVAAALNRLAGRIGELLAAERETVADLSHRLRTPLTAVRLDVEALGANERSEELQGHLDNLERTLTAVIQAARRGEREGVRPECDAVAVVAERTDFWRPLAEDQDRPVGLLLPEHAVPVRCAADDLRAAVDALLENCIAHTPEAAALAVVLTEPAPAPGAPGPGQGPGIAAVLEVRDQGPGIHPAAVRRGRSDRGSSGLGLDIARACAEASGGQLEITRADGWTVVRLSLGRP